MCTRTSAAINRLLNFCRACQRDFGGVAAFDRHLVGKHAHLYSDEPPDGRRCLSEEEMLDLGMYVNRHGRWSQPENGLSDRMGSASEATNRRN